MISSPLLGRIGGYIDGQWVPADSGETFEVRQGWLLRISDELLAENEALARIIIRDAARLELGHVGLNTATGPTPEAPFRGRKESGFGREGALEGLLEYSETQVVAAA